MICPKQKGTALITALIIVTIAASLAYYVVLQQHITIYRSALLFNTDRAYFYSHSAQAWAKNYLRERLIQQEANIAEGIAEPVVIEDQQIRLFSPDGQAIIEARLYDLQGRFNLNNFQFEDPERLIILSEQFRLLLSVVLPDIEQTRIDTILFSINDYLLNTQEESALPFVHSSQLRNLEGVSSEIYQNIVPYITALPDNATDININTASLPVLMSLWGGVTVQEAQAIIAMRQESPFDASNLAQAIETILVNRDIDDWNAVNVGVESIYFLLVTDVEISQQHLTVFTTLQLVTSEEGLAQVKILWQSIHTP